MQICIPRNITRTSVLNHTDFCHLMAFGMGLKFQGNCANGDRIYCLTNLLTHTPSCIAVNSAFVNQTNGWHSEIAQNHATCVRMHSDMPKGYSVHSMLPKYNSDVTLIELCASTKGSLDGELEEPKPLPLRFWQVDMFIIYVSIYRKVHDWDNSYLRDIFQNIRLIFMT